MDLKNELLEAGYQKVDQKVLSHENASAFFQKRITGDHVIKYFINIYEYDFRAMDAVPYDFGYQVDVNFSKGEDSYDVSFGIKSVREAESKCEELFVNMNFDVYEVLY